MPRARGTLGGHFPASVSVKPPPHDELDRLFGGVRRRSRLPMPL